MLDYILFSLLIWNFGTQYEIPAGEACSYRSIHQLELERNRHLPPPQRILPQAEVLRRARTRSLNKVVYGYYPYWVQDLGTIRWSAISHLAWFSIEMDSAGNVTASHGWPDEDTVSSAHQAGVRVDLTFTLFSGSGIQALCADPARRAAAIGNMVDLMVQGNADGISVDFEGLIEPTRDNFTLFISELRAELDSRGLFQAEISIAAPAVDWTAQFDLDALLDHADWFFIMGYGYFWSGSSRSGPTGIMHTPADWIGVQSRSMLRTLAYYSSLIPALKRQQIVYGVPYYGREWITENDMPGALVLDHVGSVTYSAARQDLEQGMERRWDASISNPWYAWQDQGQWHQVWYDDEESLAAKYALALDQGIGGVGMWALNYDTPHPELWDLLEQTFSDPPDEPVGHRNNPIPIDAFPYRHEGDTSVGPGSYFNYYSCDPDLAEYGREVVYSIDVCQAGTLDAHLPEDELVDPDLHLLSGPDQDECLGRAHLDLTMDLQPGSYLLVVDTWVDDGLELEGQYVLTADFSPQAGSQGCAAHLVCQGGQCVCPSAGYSDCGQLCADLQNDSQHCGDCSHACPDDHLCIQGQCVLAGDGGSADGSSDGGSDGDSDGGEANPDSDPGSNSSDGGCSCQAQGQPGHPQTGLLLVGLLACWLRRRRMDRSGGELP